ncbi:CRAL/TRIO domain-containing protein [Phthorimaea operculella]|nr:CRAL/TRIO domain-containing protein [Phthorimaea operculella]
MGNNFQRIFFMQNNGKKFNDDILMNAYRNIAMLIEYYKFHDYADSYVFIVDLREANLTDLIMKMGLVEARQIITLITDGYGLRLKSIDFLTNSKLIDTLVSMLKQVMSAKLGGRLRVHTTLESIYNVAPKEIMPKEYGGDEIPVAELREKWTDVLSSEEFRAKWREMTGARTNEALRPKDTFNDQYMGMPGTFRVLTVD